MINALNLALSLSGMMYFLLIWFSWSRRNNPGAKSFALLMLAYGVYSLGYYLELHSLDVKELMLWTKFEYLGIAFIPALWMLFCIQYTENKTLANRKLIAALFILSSTSLLIVLTSDYHRLFHYPVAIDFHNGLSIAVLQHRPWCWVHMIYLSITEIGGSILLLLNWRYTSGYRRAQSGAMFLGSLLPSLVSILYMSDNTPLGLDLSPFGLVLTGLIYMWGVLRYHIFELAPVARSTVFEKMLDAVMVLDGENRIIDINEAATGLFHKKPAQIGQYITEYFEELPILADKISNMDSGDIDLRLDANEDLEWIHIRISHLLNEYGDNHGRLVIIRDISTRKRDEARLEEINKELVKRVRELNQYNSHIRTLNKMISLLQVCECLEQSYGILIQYLPKVFPGIDGGLYIKREDSHLLDLVASWTSAQSLKPLISDEDCYALQKQGNYLLEPGKKKPVCAHLNYDETYAYLCIPIMVRDNVVGLFHFYTPGVEMDKKRLAADRAISDSIVLALVNIKMREMLIQQSIRDPLTHLFNRRFMEETLRREVLRAERNKTALAVIMGDIDHFKRFNDYYGHSTGDQVLQKVSRIMESCIRGDDVACRYGGEEFVLIMPGMVLEVAQKRAEVLRERVKAKCFVVKEQVEETITISLGIAVYPEHGLHPGALLKSADHAMYQAKQAGRDRVAVAGPLG